ncbi:MAG: S8 family serine peptidase [Anaerolineaceae bacterium]|nr:S8 family serine peptidase [Anaerolineaceae bacterium]
MNTRKLCEITISLILISIITGCSSNPASPTITSPSNTAAVETAVSETNSPFSENKVKQYDDVRGLDLSNQVLGEELITSLTFDDTTIWSENDKDIAQRIYSAGMTPPFGLRSLHAQGITGKGINVAIIDLPMDPHHPEIEGRIVEYVSFLDQDPAEVRFHGAAVSSILAGKNIGVAPEANIYYLAVSTETMNAQNYAKALDWVISKNQTLPEDEKIRVVSVSSIPSGVMSEYTNQSAWDRAYKRATDAGILVLDCTLEHGYTLKCTYDLTDPDNIEKCNPDWIPAPMPLIPKVNVPTSRTVAGEYQVERYKINYTYLFTGIGGPSWGVPYLAGVLALGWQINPKLTNTEIMQMVFDTAKIGVDEQRIINPVGFIDKVKSTVTAQ